MQPVCETDAIMATAIFAGYRRLKWNEVVQHGDYIADEKFQLGPWEGPSGFRADTFVRPIYRATRKVQTKRTE